VKMDGLLLQLLPSFARMEQPSGSQRS